MIDHLSKWTADSENTSQGKVSESQNQALPQNQLSNTYPQDQASHTQTDGRPVRRLMSTMGKQQSDKQGQANTGNSVNKHTTEQNSDEGSLDTLMQSLPDDSETIQRPVRKLMSTMCRSPQIEHWPSGSATPSIGRASSLGSPRSTTPRQSRSNSSPIEKPNSSPTEKSSDASEISSGQQKGDNSPPMPEIARLRFREDVSEGGTKGGNGRNS